MPSSPHRKFAVQKPKGKKWETLALVDGLEQGRAEFRQAVAQHGGGYVRLIQVDFKTEDVLSDYDWHLIELHDPFKGKGPTRPTLVAGKERRQPAPEAAATVRPARPGAGPAARGQGARARGLGSAGMGGAGNGGLGNGGMGHGGSGLGGPAAAQQRRADEKVPVPVPTYLALAAFGAVAGLLWLLWFG
ncbi:hypothetical protein [Rhodocista pekingensis]|uniref:Uncharacterized protein n=1 Tax=Rhodocista pekingensis TaxID=201185 RepID=A0ABW2KXT1_9PROT